MYIVKGEVSKKHTCTDKQVGTIQGWWILLLNILIIIIKFKLKF